MKKLLTMFLIVATIGTTMISTSCTRASKSCKANHKKLKKMRKSGQLKM